MSKLSLDQPLLDQLADQLPAPFTHFTRDMERSDLSGSLAAELVRRVNRGRKMTRRPNKPKQPNPTLLRLAKAIDASGVTQEEIALASGVSQAFISEIRTGERRSQRTFTLLQAVADAIGYEFKLERKSNGTE